MVEASQYVCNEADANKKNIPKGPPMWNKEWDSSLFSTMFFVRVVMSKNTIPQIFCFLGGFLYTKPKMGFYCFTFFV